LEYLGDIPAASYPSTLKRVFRAVISPSFFITKDKSALLPMIALSNATLSTVNCAGSFSSEITTSRLGT